MVAAQKNKSQLSEAKAMRSRAAGVETGKGYSVLAGLTKQVAYLMATLDTKTVPKVIKEIKGDSKIEGMVKGIRNWATTIKMVFIKIIVTKAIKIQHKGTGEMEVKSSSSDERGLDIWIKSVNSFKLQKGELRTGLCPKTAISQVNREAKIHTRKPISTNVKMNRKAIKLEKGPE